jgi:starch synthase
MDTASTRPIMAYLGRLVDRRGVDLLVNNLEKLLDLGLDMVVMGFGEDHYHAALAELRRKRPDALGLMVGYEMDLAHKIVGGADMLLMPSRFEPCGLHQLHALRYGTVPVVRLTGGLDDTVADHTPLSPGTGFKFGPYEADAMLEAVGRALKAHADPAQWRGLMLRGMGQDYSWERAAAQYEKLYLRAQELRRGASS